MRVMSSGMKPACGSTPIVRMCSPSPGIPVRIPRSMAALIIHSIQGPELIPSDLTFNSNDQLIRYATQILISWRDLSDRLAHLLHQESKPGTGQYQYRQYPILDGGRIQAGTGESIWQLCPDQQYGDGRQ